MYLLSTCYEFVLYFSTTNDVQVNNKLRTYLVLVMYKFRHLSRHLYCTCPDTLFYNNIIYNG